MTANAVVSAVANVPLLLAAVGLVVYMAFEAGLSIPGTVFGALGLAASGWRWSMSKRYRVREPFDEATALSARREVELNAGLSGLMWGFGALAIYPTSRRSRRSLIRCCWPDRPALRPCMPRWQGVPTCT